MIEQFCCGCEHVWLNPLGKEADHCPDCGDDNLDNEELKFFEDDLAYEG